MVRLFIVTFNSYLLSLTFYLLSFTYYLLSFPYSLFSILHYPLIEMRPLLPETGAIYACCLRPLLRQGDQALFVTIVPGKQRFIITITIAGCAIVQEQLATIDFNFQYAVADPGAGYFLDQG